MGSIKDILDLPDNIQTAFAWSSSAHLVLIPAQTGKVIRILGGIIFAAPVSSALIAIFYTNGGAIFAIPLGLSSSNAGVLLPLAEEGYFDSVVGQSIVLDTAGVCCTLRYTTFTPAS